MLQIDHTHSPFLLQIGDFGLRWYSLMYIFGFAFAWWWYEKVHRKRGEWPLKKEQTMDLIVWAFVGMLIGSRTIYMLFYGFEGLIANPLSYFFVWEGGLSFHGALAGIAISVYLFFKKLGLPILQMADRLIVPIPFTLFAGRIGNFMNAELVGRAAPDWFPMCIRYPSIDSVCRYPSQLIQAAGEGLLLFAILLFVYYKTPLGKQPGKTFGVFLLGYATLRALAELVRAPDPQLGLLFGGFTMGQLLSLPLVILGLWLLFRPTHADNS